MGDFQLLVVENDPTYIHLITQKLSDSYRLLVAKSAAKAMDVLNNNRINILLININLPDNCGLELCKKIKSDRKKYGDINIVFMIGDMTNGEPQEGVKLGASDYLLKPFDAHVLQTRIDIQTKLLRHSYLLENLAHLDGLTEIPNRQAFELTLPEVWARAQRDRSSLSLALVDLDYFKQFNDSYGHHLGDDVLIKLAQCFADTFKREADFYARYSDEVFVVLLFGCQLQNALNCIDELQHKFAQLAIKHEHSEASELVTFSAAVCTANPGVNEISEFLPSTMKLLDDAKSQGRAKVLGEDLIPICIKN